MNLPSPLSRCFESPPERGHGDDSPNRFQLLAPRTMQTAFELSTGKLAFLDRPAIFGVRPVFKCEARRLSANEKLKCGELAL